MVLLPKCPLCLVAWLGAVGLGGISSHVTGAVPLALFALFAASQGVFLVLARRTGDWRALVLAMLGVSIIAASRILCEGSSLRWLGVSLLVVAAVFNAVATSRSHPSRSRRSRK